MSNCLRPQGLHRPWNPPGHSPGDLPNPGIEPRSPTLLADSLPAEPQRNCPNAPFLLALGQISLCLFSCFCLIESLVSSTAVKTSYFLNAISFIFNPARWISTISFCQQYMKFISRYFLSFIFICDFWVCFQWNLEAVFSLNKNF